jgi:hypothetical protein
MNNQKHPSGKLLVNFYSVRFQVLMAASIKFRVFWDVALCRHDEIDRHSDDGGSTHV